MNANEQFSLLNSKSAWSFTKQIANFRDLFLSTKLFYEIPDIKNTDVEKYFSDNYKKYAVSTSRHRILAIAQMFGLITKKQFYKRNASTYSQEETTPVFEKLKACSLGSENFNIIFSEQLIKIKIKAIIDTKDDRNNYCIYPFLFLFLVMWKLSVEKGIEKVPMDKIWTYVLTCHSMELVDDAVSWICDSNSKISKYVGQYKSDSRIMTLILENTDMFEVKDDFLVLNKTKAEYFYKNFICKNNMDEIKAYLNDDEKYFEYLTNYQGFNINLAKSFSMSPEKKSNTSILKKDNGGEKEELLINFTEENAEEVDKIVNAIYDAEEQEEFKEAKSYDNESEIERSNNRRPELIEECGTRKRFKKDQCLAKTAIKKAKYICEFSRISSLKHPTFISSHGTKYLEAHHLIPMKAQSDFEKLGINLDRLENMVALCPTCHRAVHYGTEQEKIKILKPLFEKRREKLESVGIYIDFDVLLKEYY